MPVASELLVKINADTGNLEKGLSSADRQVSGFAKSASALGGVATAAFVGLGAAAIGLGAGFGASVNAASSFQAIISEVGAVSNATGSQLQGMTDLALKMGADTSFSANEAAQAMAELAKGGIEVNQMASVLPGTLNLAAAGGLGLAEAATIATDTLSIFSTQGVTMEQVANSFAGAANISSISVQDMAESMKYVGPVAASMGLTLEDTSAAIALLGANGLKGSQAGTGLRTMLVSLASPSKEAKKLMNQLGIEVFDSSGKIKDMAGISTELKDSLKGMTDQQRLSTLETLFGREGMSAAIAMMGEGENSIQSYTEKLKNAATAEATGKKMMDNFAGSMDALKGSVETAAITLGLAFLPVLRQLVDAATAGVNAAMPFIQAWGPRLAAALQAGIASIPQLIATVQTFVAAIMATFNALRTGDFSNVFGPMITAIQAAFGSETAGRVTLFISNLVTGLNLARDAVITARQAFAGDWINSATIVPAVAAVGVVFSALGETFRVLQNPLAFITWQLNEMAARFPALAGPIGAFSSVLVNFGPQIAAVAAGFVALGPAVSIVGAALPLLVGAFTGLGPIISILTSTLPLLGTVIGALGLPITLLIAAVAALGVAWTTNFMGIQTQTMPIIAAIGAMITGTLLPALAQVGSFITGTVVPAFVAGWGQVQTSVGAAAAIIVPAVQQMSAAVVSAFQAALPGIQAFGQGFMQLVGAVTPIVQQVGSVILSSLGPAVQAMGEWAATVIPQFAAAFSNIASVIGPAIGAIASTVGTMLSMVAGFITTHSATITATFTAAWGLISNIIGANMTAITTVISATLQLLAGNVTGALNTLKTGFTTAFAQIGAAAQSGMALVQSTIGTVLGAIVAQMSLGWASMVATVTSAGNAIANAASTGMAMLVLTVTTGIAQAITLIAGLPGRAAAAVGNLGSTLFSAGANLVQGFINGINSKIGEAAAAAGKLAGLIGGGITGFFEMKSPSRLTMRWGGYIVDGLMIGMAAKETESQRSGLNAGRTLMNGIIDGIDEKQADLVSKVSGAISSASKAVTDALGALSALSGFRGGPAEAQVSGFLASLTDFMERFTTAVGSFEEDVLKQAGQFSDVASKALGVVSTGVTALQSLTKFKAPLESVVSGFLSSLADFMERFSTTAGGFEDDMLAVSTVFADGVGKAVGVLSNAVSGLASLRSFRAPLETTVSAFLASVADFMEKFSTVAGGFEEDVLAAAKTFAAGAGAALGIIADGVAALVSLEKFKAPAEVAVQTFLGVVGNIVYNLQAIAAAFKAEALAHAQTFATAAGDILATIADGVSGLAQLATVQDPGLAAIQTFAGAVGNIVAAIAGVAQSFQENALSAASAFAKAGGEVLGVIGSGLEGLSKLASFVAPSQQAIDQFVYAIYAITKKMADMAGNFKGEGLAQATAFGVAAKAVFDATGGALSTFGGFKDLVVPSAQAIDQLAEGMKYVTSRMASIADEIGAKGLAQAQAFGTAVSAVFGSLKTAIDTMDKLKGFKDNATIVFDALLGGMQDAIDRAQGMVQYAKNLNTEADQYLTLMTDAAAKFAKGMAAGGASPSNTPSQLGQGIGNAVADGARDALDIHSPSEVFATIGNQIVAGLVQGMDEKAQAAAKAAADVANAVAGAVQATLAAMTSIAGFNAGRAPSSGQIGGVLAFTRDLVGQMAGAAGSLSDEGLKATDAYAKAASAVVDTFGKATDALSKLGSYVAPVGTAIYDVGKGLRAVIADFAVIAELVGAEMLTLAAGFADGAGKVADAVGKGADGLSKLATYAQAPASAIYAFGKDLRLAVQDFAAISDLLPTQVVQGAAAFADGAGKVVDVIAKGAEGLTKLNDYIAPPAAAVYAFGKTIMALVADLAAAGAAIGTDALRSAGVFADAAGKVVGLLSNGVTGFKSLSELVTPSQDSIERFAQSALAVVVAIQRVSRNLSTDGLKSAGDFAESAGKVLGIVASGVTGLKELVTFTAPAQSAMDAFATAVRDMMATLARLAGTVATEGADAAATFAEAVGKVFAGLNAGTSFFKSLDGLLLPDQAGIDRILAPMLSVVRTLAEAGRSLDAETMANASKVAAVFNDVFAGMQAGSHALAPVATGGGGGGGGQNVYYFTITGDGSDNLEDRVVAAIEMAQRRGRIQ